MKQSDLVAEVAALVEGRLAAGQVTPRTWAIEAVVHAHPDIHGADVPFYRLAAYEHVGATVRQVLRRYEPNEGGEADRQIPLPGFARLQCGYLVERDGEQAMVPIDQLTDAEVEGKAREYDRMAVGCQEHADELRRYARERRARGAA